MKKLSILLLVALLSFSFVACGDDDETTAISFVNSGNSKLKVNNTSDQDLIVYAGSPKETKPLAGVKAGQSGWGVPNPPTGLYVLYVVTQANYTLNPADPKISTSMLIYVDDTEATYDIGAGSLGDCELVVNNDSEYYVEVRNDSFNGPLFLTVRPYEHGVKYLSSDDYYLYPVVKLTKKTSTKVLGVYSKNLTDARQMKSLIPSQTAYLDVTPTKMNDTAVECLIYIYNELGDSGEIHAGDGDLIKSTLGRKIINNGNTDPFTISRVPAFGANGQPLTTTFSSTFVIKGFNKTSDPYSATFEIGKAYTLTCKADGSWTNSSIANIE